MRVVALAVCIGLLALVVVTRGEGGIGYAMLLVGAITGLLGVAAMDKALGWARRNGPPEQAP